MVFYQDLVDFINIGLFLSGRLRYIQHFIPTMQALKNIIVTGANKGIGLGIASHLAKNSSWNLIIACRNPELGQQAKKDLQTQYPQSSINLQKLDVSDSKSIDAFCEVIKQKYQQIHVLVNNAGVAAKGDNFGPEEVQWTFQTNFYGTVELTQKMLPLLAEKGKVVTLGSMAGPMTFKKMTNQDLKARWQKKNISKEEIVELMKQFQKGVTEGNYLEKGWPKWGYGVSKLGINVYHSALSRYEEVIKKSIQVYVCCPGYVNTDMTSHKGTLTIEQGIKTPVFLIDLPCEVKQELQGQFFQVEKLSSTFA